MNPDCPPFGDAKTRLQKFLRGLGHPTDVVWVFPEDLLWSGRAFLVRARERVGADGRAQAEYEACSRRRLGVAFDVLGVSGSVAFTHLFGPVNEEQAARLMMPDGLKLSVATPLHEMVVVRNPLTWWLRSLDRRSRKQAAQVLGIEASHVSAA